MNDECKFEKIRVAAKSPSKWLSLAIRHKRKLTDYSAWMRYFHVHKGWVYALDGSRLHRIPNTRNVEDGMYENASLTIRPDTRCQHSRGYSMARVESIFEGFSQCAGFDVSKMYYADMEDIKSFILPADKVTKHDRLLFGLQSAYFNAKYVYEGSNWAKTLCYRVVNLHMDGLSKPRVHIAPPYGQGQCVIAAIAPTYGDLPLSKYPNFYTKEAKL